jgi:phenylpropionate dioxygenase-like ring-hydroxylating dioxygenase large terminal subunit
MSSRLPGTPWLLAHKSMLQKDRPQKISLQGNDYVLWLDENGEVQALPNACPHMGAMLSEGWCDRGKVVCPFHALQFDGAGCTVNIRNPDGGTSVEFIGRQFTRQYAIALCIFIGQSNSPRSRRI